MGLQPAQAPPCCTKYIIIIIFFKPSKNEGRKKIEKVKKNGEANVPSGRPAQNYCATKQN